MRFRAVVVFGAVLAVSLLAYFLIALCEAETRQSFVRYVVNSRALVKAQQYFSFGPIFRNLTFVNYEEVSSYSGSHSARSQQLFSKTAELRQWAVMKFTSEEELLANNSSNRSLLEIGSMATLKLLLQEVLSDSSRKSLHVGVVGGSVSLANSVPTPYYAVLNQWLKAGLNQLAPGVTFNFTNGAISATASDYHAFCIQEHLPLTEIDILIIETTFNDNLLGIYAPAFTTGRGVPLELLIRNVKRRNPRIHLIIANFIHLPSFMGWYNQPSIDDVAKAQKEQCSTWVDEREYLDLARYYQIASVTWKHVLCSLDLRKENLMTIKTKYTTADAFHPGEWTHRQLGAFLIEYFRNAFERIAKDSEIMESLPSLPKKSLFDAAPSNLLSACYTNFNTGHAKQWSGLVEAIRNVSSSQVFTQDLANIFTDVNKRVIFTKQNDSISFELKPRETNSCCWQSPTLSLAIAYRMYQGMDKKTCLHNPGTCSLHVHFRLQVGDTTEIAVQDHLQLNYGRYAHHMVQDLNGSLTWLNREGVEEALAVDVAKFDDAVYELNMVAIIVKETSSST